MISSIPFRTNLLSENTTARVATRTKNQQHATITELPVRYSRVYSTHACQQHETRVGASSQ